MAACPSGDKQKDFPSRLHEIYMRMGVVKTEVIGN